MLTRILNSRILLRNNHIVYFFSKGTFESIKILSRNLIGKLKRQEIIRKIQLMKQRKPISRQYRMNRSHSNNIKPTIFKGMMRKNIALSKNSAKDFKDLGKNNKNMRESKRSKVLSQKKLFNIMKKNINSIRKSHKIRTTINSRMLIMILTKKFTKDLKNS